MIRLNSKVVSEGFSGTISLGEVDRLYVSGDGDNYELYGTVFRLGEDSVIVPPSESTILNTGSIEEFIKSRVELRARASEEANRLEGVLQSIYNGEYNYGVSKTLVDNLEYLSTNTSNPLPSIIVGGNLSYDELEKNNSEVVGFEEEWESWSHVYPGLKRYDDAYQQAGGITGVLPVTGCSLGLEASGTSGATSHQVEI